MVECLFEILSFCDSYKGKVEGQMDADAETVRDTYFLLCEKEIIVVIRIYKSDGFFTGFELLHENREF